MLVETVRDYAGEHALLPPEGARVIAGLSGGVDSVVLVHLLRRLGRAVTAVHVNYGVRPGAADEDEALARRYCASFEPPVPLRVARRDARARAGRRGASLQEAAREQRYAFFRKVAEEEGARHVAVGHHRDDQAETLLLNLARGSGPEGLAGMRPKRRLGEERREEEGKKGRREEGKKGAEREPEHLGGTARAAAERAHSHTRTWLVRPLLGASREEIAVYAGAQGLCWREDASNRDVRFKRAALRRDVLPALEVHFPGAAERLARSAELMRGYVDETLCPELHRRFETAREATPDGGGGARAQRTCFTALRLEALRAAPPIWQGRLLLEGLRRWCPGAPRTQGVARELAGLLDAQPGRRVDLGDSRVWRERATLRFVAEKARTDAAVSPRPLTPGRPARLPGGTVRAEVLPAEVLPAPPERFDAEAPRVALLDAERLSFPLAVRPWRDGDRLRPLGMGGHALVSDLLTEAKVPASERRRVPVVCSDGEIVWVAGHRLAEGAKVRPSTRRVARLTLDPAA